MVKKICVVGIDPGIRGGLSLLIGTKNKIEYCVAKAAPTISVEIKKNKFRDRVDELSIVPLLSGWNVSYKIDGVFIERQHVISKQGLVSSGVTMEGYGLYKGICAGLGLKYFILEAKEWQADYDFSSNDDTKDGSISWAKRLFPNVDLFRNSRCRTESDGMSDSLLIAHFGLSHWDDIN
jgi:hypothetical protein